MKTRIEYLVAMLGVILGILVFSGVARGEESQSPETWQLPPLDVTLVSPQVVELPAVIVLSSPDPGVEASCYQGTPNPEGFPVGPMEYCELYLVSRSGPGTDGRYLSEWRLPMSQPGPTVVSAGVPALGQGARFMLTVTGNAFQYGDYRSCMRKGGPAKKVSLEELRRGVKNVQFSQVFVAYYARVSTAISFQIERKVRLNGRWRWQVAKRYKPQVFPVGGEKGLTPYTRRYAKQNVPRELLYPPRWMQSTASKYQVVYVVTQGRKVLKRGVVSRRPCLQHPQPPYITP